MNVSPLKILANVPKKIPTERWKIFLCKLASNSPKSGRFKNENEPSFRWYRKWRFENVSWKCVRAETKERKKTRWEYYTRQFRHWLHVISGRANNWQRWNGIITVPNSESCGRAFHDHPRCLSPPLLFIRFPFGVKNASDFCSQRAFLKKEFFVSRQKSRDPIEASRWLRSNARIRLTADWKGFSSFSFFFFFFQKWTAKKWACSIFSLVLSLLFF